MPVITNAGGGGGATSDECTLALQDIPKGLKAVATDSDDEAREGTLSTDTSAADSHVLTGQTYFKYNGTSKHWEKRAGSRKNNGALNASLNCGESFTIPAGDTTGGKVTANSLASQTPGDAAAENILSGKTAWVNGNQLTGNMAVQSVINFKVAQYANVTLIASWALPSVGPWSGLRIVCKQGSYPADPEDGTLFYEGSGASATASLAAGAWYFRAWNYITTGAGRIYGSYTDYTVNNAVIRGQQTFTGSGTFTVPANVYSVDAFMVGGGGGGATGGGTAGAGGGCTTTVKNIRVSPGQQIGVSVGGGGRDKAGNRGGPGGDSYFGNYRAMGGTGGSALSNGGSGGSGGGSHSGSLPTYGGSDGGDGSGGVANCGFGQHTTTRAFAESWNTIYAGGGGGQFSAKNFGAGGAGGGGRAVHYGDGGSGTPNTGGGAGGKYATHESPSYGGSGVVLVRWGY